MNKKRNIDQLFQDQLSQFEATPSPEVWTQIEAKLKKEKDDRKVIPLWWKLGGVAAVLALLLTVGNGFFTSDPSTEMVIEDASIKVEENKLLKDHSSELNTLKEGVVNTDVHTIKQGVPTESLPVKKDIDKITDAKSSAHQKSNDKTGPSNNTSTIAFEPENSEVLKEKNPLERFNAPATDPTNNTANSPEAPIEEKGKAPIDPISKEKQSITRTESGVADEQPLETKTDIEDVSHKKSIFDAIEENKKEAVAVINEKNDDSWELTPNVGPVYYNSISGGSSIDPSFADNSQSGDVNLSYGVQVAYNLNDRFSIRSGVNNVNVGYSTGGVELASGPASFALKTVDYQNPNRNVLSAFDKGTIPNNSSDPNNPYAQLNLKSTSGNAEIRQNISYFEIPLEAKYVIVSSRLGVNMIGGFSTLFLNDNEISVNDGSFRSILGEANNLNSLSFSTNVGLGFDYKISSKIKFNIEPMFKYQLNPYSDTSVDFKPYYFGIYSGLSFKF